jgi:alpha-tubulin suppressor-like RCC1 family protein
VAGGEHTCARVYDTTVWCWGDNQYGQLGGGTTNLTEPRPVPVLAEAGVSFSGAVALGAGEDHTCALRSDGTVWCWGRNSEGQLGNGPSSSPLPVQVATSPGGPPLGGAVELAAGGLHTCVRTDEGGLWCWGSNLGGQLGAGLADRLALSPVRVLSTPVNEPFSNALQVVAGTYHTCARRSDGSSWCWGDNQYGQLGTGNGAVIERVPVPVLAMPGGSPFAGLTQISAGERHTCALRNDGTVWCWGQAALGQLGNGDLMTDRPNPVQVMTPGGAPLIGASELSSGSGHTCALNGDATLSCWGWNGHGQLGRGDVGTDGPTPEPVRVTAGGAPLSDVVQVSSGGRIHPSSAHTCAQTSDSNVWCWGSNAEGQLGTGAGASSASPVAAFLFFMCM